MRASRLPVGGAGLLQDLLYFGRIGVDLDLDFVEDGAEVLVEFGVEDVAQVPQGEAFFHGPFSDPDPGDVPLPDVHDALGVIDQVVDLPLQDGLEVFLHLPAGHLGEDGQGKLAGRGDVLDVRADDFDLPVFHFVHVPGGGPLDREWSARRRISR